MHTLTEELVLQKTRAEGLDAVRNLNLWGSDLTDVSILQVRGGVCVSSVSTPRFLQVQATGDFCPFSLFPLTRLASLLLRPADCAEDAECRSTVVVREQDSVSSLNSKSVRAPS